MVLVVPLPERLGHILGKFRDVLSKSQFKNFQSVMFVLIVSHCKEHDVKSIRDAISETKCQSSINRFFTSPSWSLDNIMKRAEDIVFYNLRHDDNLEFVAIDDSVCKKYGTHSEMVCYNHSTTLGTVLSHNYVTAFYLSGDIHIPSSIILLYGNKKRCEEKSIPFKTKVELCNEIIDKHRSRAKKTIVLIDSWYTVHDVISYCRKHDYGWIGDMKSNRVIVYEGKKMHVSDLIDIVMERGRFTDTIIDGEIYNAVKLKVYIPSLLKKENINIVINVRAETKDIRILCTELEKEDTVTIIRYALKRMKIENFYRDTKQLGFGEYRFRKSEAALIHAHLVFLAYILLEILRHRLLSYRIAKTMPSIEFVITWVRKKTKQRFVRYICDKLKQGTSMRSLLLATGKMDTVHV